MPVSGLSCRTDSASSNRLMLKETRNVLNLMYPSGSMHSEVSFSSNFILKQMPASVPNFAASKLSEFVHAPTYISIILIPYAKPPQYQQPYLHSHIGVYHSYPIHLISSHLSNSESYDTKNTTLQLRPPLLLLLLRLLLQHPPQDLARRTLRHLIHKPHPASQPLMIRHFPSQPLDDLLRCLLRIFLRRFRGDNVCSWNLYF